MILNPIDVLKQFPVRFTKTQKQQFRAAVEAYAKQQGYSVQTENGSFGTRNLVIGDPEQAKYVISAHYDTSANMVLPNLVIPFNMGLFVLYQLLHSVALILSAVLGGLLLGAGVFLAGLFLASQENGWIVVIAAMLTCLYGVVLLSFLFLARMFFGPANKNNANDNTSGVVALLETLRTFPENQRSKVCFVLFDLDQKGLWGAKSYRSAHKDVLERQLVINLDCVGDGDSMFLFPTKKIRENRKQLTSLYKMCGYMGKKSILVREKGFSGYPSDHKLFPRGVGICAFRKNKLCYYIGRIHTSRDTVLDETNVNILRAALTTFICRDEVN